MVSEYLTGLAEQTLGISEPGQVQPRPVHAFERRAAPAAPFLPEQDPIDAPAKTVARQVVPGPFPEHPPERPERMPRESQSLKPSRPIPAPANESTPGSHSRSVNPIAALPPTPPPGVLRPVSPVSIPPRGPHAVQPNPPETRGHRLQELPDSGPPILPRQATSPHPEQMAPSLQPKGASQFGGAIRPAPRPVPPPEPPSLPELPTVQVTIGRLEVRLTGAAAPAVRTAPPVPTTLSLAEYLQSRDGKRR